MAKTASLKTIALRALKNPKSGAATKLVALRAAKPYLEPLDYEQRLRQLADIARTKVLRLLLVELTEIDAARRARSAQRTEVDEILRQCEAELAAEERGAPKSTPANAAPTPSLEPRPASPSIPITEFRARHRNNRPDQPAVHAPAEDAPVASETVSKQLDDPAMGTGEGAGAREALLAEGRKLSARVIFQYERWCRAPLNAEESARLRGLQKQFAEWEHTAKARCPGLNTQKEFPDTRLRPYERKVAVDDLARTMRTPSPWQAHLQSIGLARQRERKPADDGGGMWSGLPRGI